MRIPSTLKWAFVVGLVAVAAGTAAAQPRTGGGGGSTNSGEVPFQKKTTLSPDEQLGEATKHLSRMEGAAGGVRKMLAEARKQRDVVKTLCINDKVSQVDVAVRSGKDRHGELTKAVKRVKSGDSQAADLANHHYTIITVLRQRTEQLVAEANQCIGEESAFVGETKTSVQVDPEIPKDEAKAPELPPPLTVVLGPPQCTSCTD